MRSINWVTAVAVLALTATHAQSGRAQGRPAGGVNTPTISPYLNLARPGASPAINYYGLVRPQQDFARSIYGLQLQGQLQQQNLSELQAGGGLVQPTGHTIDFLNYGGYFLSTGSGRPLGNTLAPPRVTPGIGGVTPSRISGGSLPAYGRR
jgi:hypothetical protein